MPSIPSIDGVTDPVVKKILLAIKEVLEVRQGTRPRSDDLDKFVSFRDLFSTGIASVTVNGQSIVNSQPDNSVITPIAQETNAIANDDLIIPNAPTGLIATGTKLSVLLEWDDSLTNIAYTEIYRSTFNNIGLSVLIGSTEATIYVDYLNSANTTRYYWIRHVNKAGIAGSYNALTGTIATTQGINSPDIVAIDGAKIIDATIFNAKIANVSADKIRTGTLQAAETVTVGAGANRIIIDGQGNIRSGAADFLNGNGMWQGISGGIYKFFLGQQDGKFIAFDGTNFDISGNIRNGQSTYAAPTGTGFFAGTDVDNIWKVSIGNSDRYVRYNGVDLLINTDNFQLTSNQLTFNGGGTFTGSLQAATGSFGGQLLAGVLDFSQLDGVRFTYLSPGTYTITVPVGKTTLRVSLCGGAGGGGASGNDSPPNAVGGTGGGSNIITQIFLGLTAGANYTLIVGAGGLGGVTNASLVGGTGQNGGLTSISGLITTSSGKGGTGGIGQGQNGTNGAGGDGANDFKGRSNNGGSRGGFSGSDGGGRNGGAGENGKAFIEFFNPNSVVLQTTYQILISALQRQGIATT